MTASITTNTDKRDALLNALIELAEESRELRGTHIPVFEREPTSIEFQRLVASNRPAIFKNLAKTWPAFTKWRSRAYLEDVLKGQYLTVATTPNGLADAVVDGKYFCMPHETKMQISELLDHLSNPVGPIVYLQSQNNNLHQEFSALRNDVPLNIPFASEALGRDEIDAVNVWFGTERSASSLHKDPYENLYAVIAGKKTFVLIPPNEAFCLHESKFRDAVYTPKNPNDLTGEWDITPTEPPSWTPWIPIDPWNVDDEKYPFFRHCSPMIVTIEAGDVLYLPSLWYHHVGQEQEQCDGFSACIAANYWFDMEFDSKYAYFNFVRNVSELLDDETRETNREARPPNTDQ